MKVDAERVRAARAATAQTLGKRLTQEESAALVHVSRREWQRWEAGEAMMPAAAFELYQIKTGQARLMVCAQVDS